MSEYKVLHQQSIFDIVTEQYGTLNNLIDVARQNTLDFDVTLTTGQILEVRNTDKGYKDIIDEIAENGQVNNNAQNEIFVGSGIGAMIIETDFTVA